MVAAAFGWSACKADYSGAGGSSRPPKQQEPGAVDFQVSCAGAACGNAGDLVGVVNDPGCAGHVLDTANDVQTAMVIASNASLTAGKPVTGTIGGLPIGGHCVDAYLAGDGGSAKSVVSSAGPLWVDVPAGGSVTASIVLDTPASGAGGGTGTVTLDVSCSGAGCGKPGTLHGELVDCFGTGAVVAGGSLGGENLVAGAAPIAVSVGGAPSGSWCARAWLDVTGDGRLDAGDAVSSMQPTVDLEGGGTASAGVTLDQTQY